ncbi:MAG: DUF1816 domain-containing protein [Leptolyngbyaceae cyanobacterium]
MKNVFSKVLGSLFGSGKDWWIEIKTDSPTCTYYFGPFSISEEATLAKAGYVDDLTQEGAQNIQATMMHCKQPASLTVCDDGVDVLPNMAPQAT